MESVNCKANRALELIQLLSNDYKDWQRSSAPRITTECNELRTKFIIGVEFAANSNRQLRWSLMTGDILFNLRCALDHLIYFLAARDSAIDPPKNARKLMFPVSNTPDAFESAIGRGQITGLNADDENIIREFQPFVTHPGAPESSPLYLLSELNNIDKHRHIHVATFTASNITADLKGLPQGDAKITINENPLGNKDWLFAVETNAPCAGPAGAINVKLRLGLDEPFIKKEELLVVLKTSAAAVCAIIKKFS